MMREDAAALEVIGLSEMQSEDVRGFAGDTTEILPGGDAIRSATRRRSHPCHQAQNARTSRPSRQARDARMPTSADQTGCDQRVTQQSASGAKVAECAAPVSALSPRR